VDQDHELSCLPYIGYLYVNTVLYCINTHIKLPPLGKTRDLVILNGLSP
jgi:hypothetical protein